MWSSCLGVSDLVPLHPGREVSRAHNIRGSSLRLEEPCLVEIKELHLPRGEVLLHLCFLLIAAAIIDCMLIAMLVLLA